MTSPNTLSTNLEITDLRDTSVISRETTLEGLIVGESTCVLPLLQDESVNLIHTSPPYNIEKRYTDSTDDLGHSEYITLIETVFRECYRLLKPRASLFLQTGYSQNNSNEVLPIDMMTYDMMRGMGYRLWDRIIWHYRGGPSFSRKFKNTHETILWWVKPDAKGSFEPFFDVDAVRECSISYDKRNNLFGKNPGNVWSEDRVAFGGKNRATSHIAIYPESISERLIRACTRPGDMVLDPFSGSGTTAAMARLLDRRWIGIEISESYAREALKRIQTKQPSEVATLTSELVKFLVFNEKPSTTSVSFKTVCYNVSSWINDIDDKRYSDILTSQLGMKSCDIDKVSSIEIEKNKKPQIWLFFDELFARDDEAVNQEPILLTSKLLDRVYPQRRKWNNVRKFLHSVEILNELKNILKVDLDRTIFETLESEPGSYELNDDKSNIYFKTSSREFGALQDKHMTVEQTRADGAHTSSKEKSGKLGIETHE